MAASETDLETALSYELSSFPLALLESVGLLREPQKSTFADNIWKLVQCQQTEVADNVQYILDGGALLHRIPWQKGSTFSRICVEKVWRGYCCL